ncbi:MAG: alpha-L-fucosidase [Pseudopedobacter saltans]|uniref:alpha-L-fucosidase n=1 Tax=Pseudopedobacter saltans TaxID=151895 RepID=A0A2W5F6K1_9SPHI|nr:MAG: alpha-L-fucosidase [Pseudopedobacter saltans]
MLISRAQNVNLPKVEVEARTSFSKDRFGMFIHWGLFSLLGDGEWVLNNRNIPFENYKLLEKSFNPVDFDADKWVSVAKAGGMKYITLVTRHHDGFSLWDTKYSDFNIMHTPYKKDIVKQLADACHQQGLKIFFYYSLLDWGREDYSFSTGRTGKGTGRKSQKDWNAYIQFMKNQLTELLTNYGEVAGIWFDGYWDQMPVESSTRKDSDVYVDWHIKEIYDLIHKLQPQCLIGNNHHMKPMPGEDFQMFEQDVPGENSHGLSFQKPSDLPLETCATMNNNWGYDIKDDSYKSFPKLIALLVKSAGAGANLLLNIGPLPNGEIQSGFSSRIDSMGNWMRTYGASVYNTNGGYIAQQQWGVITQTPDKMFIHILNKPNGNITLPSFPFKKIKNVYSLNDHNIKVNYQFKQGVLTIENSANMEAPPYNDPDKIIVVEGK